MRMRDFAATYIQKVWKGYQVRKWYQNLKNNCTQFQARVRGNFVRFRYKALVEQQRRLSKQRDVIFSVLFIIFVLFIFFLLSFLCEFISFLCSWNALPLLFKFVNFTLLLQCR